jgi:hypothetical protein
MWSNSSFPEGIEVLQDETGRAKDLRQSHPPHRQCRRIDLKSLGESTPIKRQLGHKYHVLGYRKSCKMWHSTRSAKQNQRPVFYLDFGIQIQFKIKTHWCSSYNTVEVIWITLHSFESLPASGATSEVIRFVVWFSIVLLGDFFANDNASVEAAVYKVMDDIRVSIKCLVLINIPIREKVWKHVLTSPEVPLCPLFAPTNISQKPQQ